MTDEAKALVHRMRNLQVLEYPHDRIRCADLIETQAREIERLNSLINDTANHWLHLQRDHPVGWVGAVDTAMEAACDEIRRLSAALAGDNHD